MKKLILAATCAAALLAAGSAGAAQMITFTTPMPDSSFTGMFGHQDVDAGVFNDVYTFTLPTGVAGWTISSIFNGAPATNNIDFTSVKFNGVEFNVTSTGNVEQRYLAGQTTASGSQSLIVKGISGGNATYDGTLAFSALTAAVTAVPEPGSWALMILGFGGVGALIRDRRRQPFGVAAA